MYNLLVSGGENSWGGSPIILELSRCVREHTDAKITHEYGVFTREQIRFIRNLPCIFAYEAVNEKDPKFGRIRNITVHSGKVRIEYDLIHVDNFISYSDFPEMLFELDLGTWEMNRTHWAIIDVDLYEELSLKGVVLPKVINYKAEIIDITEHDFSVALSFPGEVRDYVASVVSYLERGMGRDTYFYDNNYKAQLARPSLDVLLQGIYGNQSKLVVVFLCEKYQEKEWCGIEFKAIREIIMERENDRIMFIRMDDGKVEGVFKTDGYIDGTRQNPEEIAEFIMTRVGLLSN